MVYRGVAQTTTLRTKGATPSGKEGKGQRSLARLI